MVPTVTPNRIRILVSFFAVLVVMVLVACPVRGGQSGPLSSTAPQQANDASQQSPSPGNAKINGEEASEPRDKQNAHPPSSESPLNWESEARLHHSLGTSAGTLTLTQDGLVFRPTKGSALHWPFFEIQTFDLLNPHRLVVTDYENRSWHRHGDRKYRFDLSTAMPPDVAAELARSIGKPVRNGDPNPTATSFATIPARHRTFAGGSNGTLRFSDTGIDYLTPNGKDERSWRWPEVETLANPDPFHLRVNGYRGTFVFELKQPMPKDLFNRLWNEVYARDMNRGDTTGANKNP